MKYNTATDQIPVRGYIDKEYILSKYHQEEIFELVFGFLPDNTMSVLSPFREDRNPHCTFRWHKDKLYFIDYRPMDCFSAVQLFFNLPDFFHTLQFIQDNLVSSKTENDQLIMKKEEPVTLNNPEVVIAPREFQKRDRVYWNQYGIAEDQLMEDRVFPLSSFTLLHTRKGNIHIPTYDLAYAYTDFDEERKKIYRPHQIKGKKFSGNCNSNDIFCLSSLPLSGEQLIITKSYKDSRVLINLDLNAVGFQSECCVPDTEVIVPLLQRFDKVWLLYDNDQAGITNLPIVAEKLNSHFPYKVTPLHLPISLLNQQIKDPADLVCRKGQRELINFLNQYNIL